MIARIVTLMLIVVLAIPGAMVSRPAETSQSPWGDVAVAAKGKKHKKKDKPPNTKTVTHTVSQLVTQTFASTQPITIPNGAPGTTEGKANPYPSTIEVSGFNNGTITDVNLILTDFTHALPFNVDVLLSTNDGRRALVMSDVIDGDDALNVDLILDDEAAAPLPATGAWSSGTFRPTNIAYASFPDTFEVPAPTPNGDVALSTFDGADPNGTWQLWVMDDVSGDSGSLGGWALEITAEVDVEVEEPAKDKQHKKKAKKRR